MWRYFCRKVPKTITMTFWTFTFDDGAKCTEKLLNNAVPVDVESDQKTFQNSQRFVN